MKKSFRKFHPRLINYRCYKNFSNEVFRECLLEKISKEVFVNNDEGLQRFSYINLQVLNQHASQKIKYVRGNQIPSMTKQLSKEIMKRSRLRNNFLRNRTEENKVLYNRQITSLEKASKALFEWFENNLLKSNADKCHLLVSSSDAVNLRISEYDIKNSECEKLLDVKFDNKLTFEKHITNICRKASRKIHALARIAPHMDSSKRPMVMNAFFNSQFNYCPLIWMCHNRTTNRKINRLHERCLRIIYNDKQSSFKMLLEKDISVSIHDRNIQCPPTEMYKLSNELSPPIVSNIFTQQNCHSYNLRLNSQFSRPLVRSVFHGTKSISYLGPVIWDILPDSYKNLPNFSVFKNRIKMET